MFVCSLKHKICIIENMPCSCTPVSVESNSPRGPNSEPELPRQARLRDTRTVSKIDTTQKHIETRPVSTTRCYEVQCLATLATLPVVSYTPWPRGWVAHLCPLRWRLGNSSPGYSLSTDGYNWAARIFHPTSRPCRLSQPLYSCF